MVGGVMVKMLIGVMVVGVLVELVDMVVKW